MSSLPIGFGLFVLVLLTSTPLSAWATYLNTHSIIIVVGGTVAILALSTPFSTLRQLMRSLLDLTKPELELEHHSNEFSELSELRRLNSPSKHPLINYAVELWDNGTSPEVFLVLLSQRREHLDAQSAEAVQALRSLAKYPPALGMTGTVMGLVTLFANLSSENKAALGPALGLAMTATFFGLLLANGLIQPLSDRLHAQHARWRQHTQSIYELLLLVNRKEPSTLVQGEIKDRVATAA